MYYVTMTDNYGWSLRNKKIKKKVIVCKSMKQAETVKENIETYFNDKSDIFIKKKKPYYNSRIYTVEYKNIEELGRPYLK